MRVAHEATGEGTTLIGPSFPSRNVAGPLSGAAYLDSFVPLLVDLYGEGWCAGGNLSVLFKAAAQAGEMLSAQATPGRERARLEMRSPAMALICQGTGADHADAGCELSRRLLTQEAAPRSAIRILAGLSIGAEVHDLALSLPGAASGAALSPSEVVELAAAACAPAVGDVLALIAADNRRAKFARQIRILAKRLVDSAPARVPAEAEHGRKRPVQAVRCDLARGHATHLLRKRGVPGASSSQLRGKDCSLPVQAVTVNGVDAKEYGDAEACIHRLALNPARILAQHMQKRARTAPRPEQRLLLRHIGVGHLHHLRRLFRQRHAGEEFVYAGFHG